MKYELYTRVALTTDLPEHRLQRGDVATLVEHHAGHPGQEPGYKPGNLHRHGGKPSPSSPSANRKSSG